jgi:hypothetical protein
MIRSFSRIIVNRGNDDGVGVMMVWNRPVTASRAGSNTSWNILSASLRLTWVAVDEGPRRLVPVRFVRLVRPDSDMPSICVDEGVGESSGVFRLDNGKEIGAEELATVLPKKRTMNVNSAEALSSSTRFTDRKTASTGTA